MSRVVNQGAVKELDKRDDSLVSKVVVSKGTLLQT